MNNWTAQHLVEARLAELRAVRAERGPAPAQRATATGRRGLRRPGWRQQLGHALVEAGLHLITAG
ncbi:MAG TPA: hypothetical protein VME46_00210 [Acidimicrobiales bacterium]|nr:hypothetical protein [Acidimicrobiales bacterium]